MCGFTRLAARVVGQELARLEKGGESYELRRLAAENESLKAENAKLQNELANAGARGWRRQPDGCDPRDATRRNLDKHAPLKDVWKRFSKASIARDVDAGTSSARRYCDAVELYADIRDRPIKSDDPLCESMDPVDERNQTRVLSGLVLWAQMGRL